MWGIIVHFNCKLIIPVTLMKIITKFWDMLDHVLLVVSHSCVPGGFYDRCK